MLGFPGLFLSGLISRGSTTFSSDIIEKNDVVYSSPEFGITFFIMLLPAVVKRIQIHQRHYLFYQ